MHSQEQKNNVQSQRLKPKEIFAIELGVDFRRIAYIADDMQSMLDGFEKPYTEKAKNKYVYLRSSIQAKNILLSNNIAYEHDNIRPPHKNFSTAKIRNPRKTNNINDASNNQQQKRNYGKEESVKMHDYNDYLPMAISVKDFSSLYTPKTVKYIWSGNCLDYEVAMTLKADLNRYLGQTSTQRANYMADITNIRTITEADLENDACDIELLGHRGVFAKKNIPIMSIIGVYTGVFIQDPADMITLMQKMPMEHFKDYLFRIPMQDNFPKITGYQYGNRLSLINAASNYQDGDDITFDQIRRRANIMLVLAKSNECPNEQIAENENCPDVLFFIAGRDIPQGTQLFYDYGNVYW